MGHLILRQILHSLWVYFIFHMEAESSRRVHLCELHRIYFMGFAKWYKPMASIGGAMIILYCETFKIISIE